MKKLIVLMLVCLFVFALAGCERTPVGEFVPIENENTSARFQEIGRETINDRTDKDCIEDVQYYVDTHTNIVYIYFIDWDANATRGGISVLYNEDGKPMTLDEFRN